MYSRNKETYLDAIGYEVEMLRFCRERIQQQPSPSDTRATSLHVEGFLLHFRNLIRFFSGKRPRPYDLSTAEPETWAGRLLTSDEIMLFQVAAEFLDDDHYQAISKYLQHCTALPQKGEQEWNIDGMFEEIAPLVREFERRFLTLSGCSSAGEPSKPSATGSPTPLLVVVPDKGQT
jgi:hypothetical protein